uniref:AF4/FMR2 family member 3-like n=1 Tax=Pristiophorus japonicus TaxID=55135 RepID=UPI00398E3ABF
MSSCCYLFQKKLPTNRSEQRRTGGGPPVTSDITDMEKRMLTLVGRHPRTATQATADPKVMPQLSKVMQGNIIPVKVEEHREILRSRPLFSDLVQENYLLQLFHVAHLPTAHTGLQTSPDLLGRAEYLSNTFMTCSFQQRVPMQDYRGQNVAARGQTRRTIRHLLRSSDSSPSICWEYELTCLNRPTIQYTFYVSAKFQQCCKGSETHHHRQSFGVEDDLLPLLNGPMQQTQGTASGNYSDEPSSSSESESSSESDSQAESCSSDTNSSKPSHINTPEPEQTSTNKWQLDKWLNKVNSHNNNTTVSENGNYGLSNNQFHSLQQYENQERAKGLVLSQTDLKERENQSPNREKQRPRTDHETKSGKQKLPTHNESASQRRTLDKKQPKNTGKMSIGDDLSFLNSENQCIISKGKGSQDSSTSDQHKTKPNANKVGPRKELQTGFLCEKRKHKGSGKNIPKSREFIDTESPSSSTSSGSGRDSDNEEFIPAKFPSSSTSPDNHKLHDWSNSLSRVKSCSAVSSVNRTTNESTNDSEGQLFALVPFGRNELISSLKDNVELRSLWVKIDLTLLSRIPGQLPKESLTQKNTAEWICNSNVNEDSSPSREKTSTKARRKRKSENNDTYSENKKNHLDKEPLIALLPSTDSSSVPCQKAMTINELSKQANEREKILQPPVSPLSYITDQKYPIENNTTIGGNNDTVLPNSISSSFSSLKHWKSESKSQSCTKDSSKGLHINSKSNHLFNNQSSQPPQASSWSSASKGQKDFRRPRIVFDDKQHNANYYMQEAKRMKHKADAVVEKFGKAVNYIDAALSFIECGNAMEHGPLEAKSPYTMYSETVELIRYVMRLKTHSGATATQVDKQLATLCYRCLALLYWRMFRLKRDNAVKYSRALINYFKDSGETAQTSNTWGASGM